MGCRVGLSAYRWNYMMLKKTLIAVSVATLLTGCSDDDPKNIAPVAEITEPSEIFENTEFTMEGSASDEDGSVSSYLWEVVSGPVSISGENTGSAVTIAADAVEEDTTATVALTVTDDDDEATTVETTFTVANAAPAIELAESFSGEEKSDVAVTAAVNLPSGNIASAVWSLPDSSGITLSNDSAESVTLTLPEVQEDTTSTLTLTVVDDDGDEVTATTSINIEQITLPITMSGLATDSPLANANIEILVDGQVIRDDITTNENGEFEAELQLDDSFADSFLTIRAFGIEEQSAAGLISLVANVGELAAMNDGDVDRDSVSALTVSNLTTARFALMQRAAGEDVSLHNQNVIDELSTAISGSELLQLATAIKVAIDMAGTEATNLPEGFSNTLELLADDTATANYVATVSSTPEYEEAQQQILDDPNLAASGFTFPESFNLYETYVDGLSAGSRLYRFNADGTGTMGQANFTWTKEGATIHIDYDESALSMGFVSLPGYDNTVKQLSGLTEAEMTVALDSNGVFDLMTEHTTIRTFPDNPELEDEFYTGSGVMTAKMDTQPMDFTAPVVAYLPLPGIMPNYPIDAGEGVDAITRFDAFTLAADGSIDGHYTDISATYTLNNDGAIVVDLEPNEDSSAAPDVIEYHSLGESSELSSFVAVSGRDNEGNLIGVLDVVGNAFIGESSATFTADNAVGVYGYETRFFESPLDNFWWELKANGDANTYSTSDYNGDGELSDDEVNVYTGTWSLDEDGVVTVTRFIDTTTWSYSNTCRSETETCKLFNDRTMKLIAMEDEKLFIEHGHRFYYSIYGPYNSDQLTMTMRPIRQWDEAPVDLSGMNPDGYQAVSQDKQPDLR